MIVPLAAALLAGHTLAHGAHHAGEKKDGESYIEHHMRTEHHIDAFDLESVFALHDLNRDGVLDAGELMAIYGVNHETSRENSENDEQHDKKAHDILLKVLAKLDYNKDGVVTKTEFVHAGTGGLPEFENYEGLGHHYDSEGEYFLHHEELYHNTPETQTEDSYTHPEDIKHFEQHEDIERDEEDKARKAQGLPATDPDKPIDEQTGMDEEQIRAQAGMDNDQIRFSSPSSDGKKKSGRESFQAIKYREAAKEASKRGEWGSKEEGFKRPKDKADRLRANIPYKYKIGKSSIWGDF